MSNISVESVVVEKGRKSLEQNIIQLRQELQVLYESLKNKNEQLMNLEKDIYDRDLTIKYLNEECQKLKNSANRSESSETCINCMKKINHDTVKTKLHKELEDRENSIQDLNRKIIRLSENLIFVQKESLSKNDKIEELMHEVDKFRQVVTNENIKLKNNNKVHNRFDHSQKLLLSSIRMMIFLWNPVSKILVS